MGAIPFNMPVCWICRTQNADSGEHAIKRSLLKLIHGSELFPKGNRLVKIEDDKKIIVQSINSDFLKFKKTICDSCNSSYSKPWDEEFDLFIRHLITRWNQELGNGYFNLKNSHPGCQKKHSNYLYRYFCKIFGCALVDCDIGVPQDIVDAVNGRSYRNNLGITICIEQDFLNKGITPNELLSTFDLKGDNANHRNYRWGLTIGFIKIGFWYKTPKHLVLGERWYGKSKKIWFGVNSQ